MLEAIVKHRTVQGSILTILLGAWLLAASGQNSGDLGNPFTVVQSAKGPINLSDTKVTVMLSPKVPSRMVRTLVNHNRFYMIVTDIQTDQEPGIIYTVYLNYDSHADDTRNESHYVGTLNFFSANQNHGQFKSYDVTAILKTLVGSKERSFSTSITFIPIGKPQLGSHPKIGSVTLAISPAETERN